MQSELTQINSKSKKDVIIVVGQAGVGKTSFIKYFVEEQDKSQFQVKSSIFHQTMESYLVKAAPKYNKREDYELHFLDTPGLDSINQVYSILEDVDDIILKEMCNLIGIAYLVNIGSREIGKDSNSNEIWYYRVRHQKKSKLQLLIFSKWDKFFLEKETNNECLKEWENHLNKNNMSSMWENKIFWATGPPPNSNLYHNFQKRKQKDPLKQICETQQISWMEILSSACQQLVSFSQYETDYEKFLLWHVVKLEQKIQSNPNLEREWNNIQEIQVSIDIMKKQSQAGKKIGIASTALGAIGTIAGLGRIGLSIFVISTAATLTAGTILIPIVSGLGVSLSITAIRFGLSKLMKKEYELEKNVENLRLTSNEQQQLRERLRKKFIEKKKQIYLRRIFDSIKVKKEEIYFRKDLWVKEVFIQINQDWKPFIERLPIDALVPSISIKCRIPEPSQETFFHDISMSAKDFYGPKPNE